MCVRGWKNTGSLLDGTIMSFSLYHLQRFSCFMRRCPCCGLRLSDCGYCVYCLSAPSFAFYSGVLFGDDDCNMQLVQGSVTLDFVVLMIGEFLRRFVMVLRLFMTEVAYSRIGKREVR